MTPLKYAEQACATMMRKFAPEDLPPKGRFHYHQGVFLSGLYQTYLLNQDRKLYDYMKAWVDSCIDENGELKECDPGQLDDLQPGILLYPLYADTKDPKYKKVLDFATDTIRDFNRNQYGGFWHKTRYPNQMWLDGLYMGGPIMTMYAKAFDKPEYFDISIEQALLMREKTEDPKTGLWFHAYDASLEIDWCDKKTGLSPEFWGRSIGWVPVAILDELDDIPKDYPKRGEMEAIVTDLCKALVKFQHESGMWYQVVDKADHADNWPEVSCTCLYVAAICKAVRTGLLPKEYLEYAKKGYEAAIGTLEFDGDDLLLGGVCVGTGVGDYTHYINRPTSTNDLHGMGAFLIMCVEAQKVLA